jgi:hypothetical protein
MSIHVNLFSVSDNGGNPMVTNRQLHSFGNFPVAFFFLSFFPVGEILGAGGFWHNEYKNV